MADNASTTSTKVITPEAMLSYPHLFKPQAAEEGEKEKYSASLVFSPEAQATPQFKAMQAAAVAAAVEKFGGKDKVAKMIKAGQLRMPFRNDAEAKGYPEGSVFINARTEQRPGIVDIIPDPSSGKPMVITDEDRIYPGLIVRASVRAFGYDAKGNKGVGFALGNIQRLRDGERLDGRMKAEDEFEADASAVADLADLTMPGEAAGSVEEEESDDLADLLK